MEFFSFILQSHSFKYRQVDRQVLSALIVLKIYFEKKQKTIHEKWVFYKFLIGGIKKLICDSRITNPYSNYDLCLVKILQLLCLEKAAVFP